MRDCPQKDRTMAWYKNISNKVRPVPVGDGNVVSVKPGTEVEVVAETPGFRRVKKFLVRTGRPKNPQKARKIDLQKEVAPKVSEFASQIIEREQVHRAPKGAAPNSVPVPVETKDAAAVKAEDKKSDEKVAAKQKRRRG